MATPTTTAIIPYIFSDYSQWERKQPTSNGRIEFKKSHSSCFTKKRPTKRPPSSAETSQDNQIRPRLLQIQIAQRKHSIAMKLNQVHSLERRIKDMISSIQRCDAETSDTVSGILSRYHRFKGCLVMVDEQSKKALNEAHKQLTEVIDTQHNEIQGLQNMVNKRAKQLKKQNKQLQTLLSYKDKEYPLKLVQIEQLKVQLEYLDEKHQREESELENALEEQRAKQSQVMNTTRLRLEDEATEHHLKLMNDSTLALGLHNKIMEKELIAHEKQLYHVKRDISILKDKIKMTKTLIAENPPHQLTISTLGRCGPETDIVLDIPVINNQDNFIA